MLGGGPIGCELAQAFARLGSQVALVEMADRLLLREEPRASALVAERLRADGVAVRAAARATEVRDGELLLDSGEAVAFDLSSSPPDARRAPATSGSRSSACSSTSVAPWSSIYGCGRARGVSTRPAT